MSKDKAMGGDRSDREHFPLRIMIVDDDERWACVVGKFITDCASTQGVALSVMTETRGARVVGSARQFHPDAIVLDSYLRSTDSFEGIELKENLRECVDFTHTLLIRIDEGEKETPSSTENEVYLDRFEVPTYLCEYIHRQVVGRLGNKETRVPPLPYCHFCKRYRHGEKGRHPPISKRKNLAAPKTPVTTGGPQDRGVRWCC